MANKTFEVDLASNNILGMYRWVVPFPKPICVFCEFDPKRRMEGSHLEKRGMPFSLFVTR